MFRKIILSALLITSFFTSGCKEHTHEDSIKFATSGDYPPFEYLEADTLKGFDIDLAKLIAKELHKNAEFENMQFSTIFIALQNNAVDAAISTITATEERKKNFDFSDSYYTETIAAVYLKDSPLKQKKQLANKKIACQLGATMEVWLKEHVPSATISALDSTNQIIEAVKAKHVDAALIDRSQAEAFAKKNPSLAYSIIAESNLGYSVAMPKNSPLTAQINTALQKLHENGEIAKLKDKWLSPQK